MMVCAKKYLHLVVLIILPMIFFRSNGNGITTFKEFFLQHKGNALYHFKLFIKAHKYNVYMHEKASYGAGFSILFKDNEETLKKGWKSHCNKTEDFKKAWILFKRENKELLELHKKLAYHRALEISLAPEGYVKKFEVLNDSQSYLGYGAKELQSIVLEEPFSGKPLLDAVHDLLKKEDLREVKIKN